MKDLKRSIRRHHMERLKKNRCKYYNGNKLPRVIGMLAHTATICSCHMCGNPRKYFKELTIQEKRFLEIII